MKKIIYLTMLLAIAVLLSACGTTKNNSKDDHIEETDVVYEMNDQNGTSIETPVSNSSAQTYQTPAQCSHSWKSATCQSPKICTKCGATEGGVASCQDNGSGKCTYCGKDLFLEKIKDGLSMQLIVPSIGASNNYYFQIKIDNNTGSTLYLSSFAQANGRLCDNSQADNYALQNGYYITVPYYNGYIEYNNVDKRWSDYQAKYANMYLDNSSLGYTVIQTNGKRVFVKFGTSGITKVGYSLQDIDVY